MGGQYPVFTVCLNYMYPSQSFFDKDAKHQSLPQTQWQDIMLYKSQMNINQQESFNLPLKCL